MTKFVVKEVNIFMRFDGAVIKEQGITFAIVVVKPSVLQQHSSEIEKVRAGFSRYFPKMPVILMAQNTRGIPKYHGRTDIVKFLANIDPRRIPWKTYTAS
jgi:hypothetical protein